MFGVHGSQPYFFLKRCGVFFFFLLDPIVDHQYSDFTYSQALERPPTTTNILTKTGWTLGSACSGIVTSENFQDIDDGVTLETGVTGEGWVGAYASGTANCAIQYEVRYYWKHL